jgi:hypothetical protein
MVAGEVAEGSGAAITMGASLDILYGVSGQKYTASYVLEAGSLLACRMWRPLCVGGGMGSICP